MGGRFIARGGWDIESIAVDGRACYRVSRHGFLVGKGYYSPAAIEALPEAHGLGEQGAPRGGWKKFEPLWDLATRAKRVGRGLPLLESILAGFGDRPARGSGSAEAGHGDSAARRRTVRT